MNAMADKVIRLSDGRALGYAEYGSPLGEPVIYCHGAPSSRVEGNLSLHAVAADRGGALDQHVRVEDRVGADGEIGRASCRERVYARV